MPKPSGRQVLVRVKAASLCHSDIHIMDGETGGDGFFPLIFGHEAVTIAEELGPDAASFGIGVGDVLGSPLYNGMCLECSGCRHHGQQFCKDLNMKGVTIPGFFSEYTLVDAASAVILAKAGTELPVPLRNLAPVFCAGITVWDALERAQVKASDTIAIVGAGGLGQLACQYAHAMGAKVLAFDVRDEQLAAVSSSVNGAINTAKLSGPDLIAEVLRLNNNQLIDTALVTSGVSVAYLNTFPLIRPNGKLIAVGIPGEAVPVQIGMLSMGCTR